MQSLTKDEFYRAVDDIKEGIGGIHDRLDKLNSRTRKLEQKVAVMWVLWTILGSTLLAAFEFVR